MKLSEFFEKYCLINEKNPNQFQIENCKLFEEFLNKIEDKKQIVLLKKRIRL